MSWLFFIPEASTGNVLYSLHSSLCASAIRCDYLYSKKGIGSFAALWHCLTLFIDVLSRQIRDSAKL
jgi:hypothetical protein